MMTRLYKKILLCVFLSTSLSLTAAPLNKLVVFGDSLSDNGNLAAVQDYSFLNLPPYHHGFTNGSPAVEQLATLLKTALLPSYYFSGTVYGNNFAVAGARASGNRVIDLNAQVGAFLWNQHGIAPNDTLYVIFIGGNDIRDMRDQANEITANTILNMASGNIQNALLQLHNAGANHFLVVNAADNGKLPETRLLAAYSTVDLLKRGYQKTTAFNEKLEKTVESIEKSQGVDIELFDLMTFFNGILNHANPNHFSNATDACYSSVYFAYYPICDDSKMDSFVFFDEIHPTQRVHALLGHALFSEVSEEN
ncbi:MAG: SGNH/GDSL hydrolase family protein [Methylococcaceae bacterium]|nr:SGNH/GDSL hydrolase family protein [Methylococcaceae bacterium]